MRKWLLIPAILIGWGITWLDSDLNWDDTSITALLIVISTGLLGFFSPNRPWLWALAVGIWIPLVGLFIRHNFGGVLALGCGFHRGVQREVHPADFSKSSLTRCITTEQYDR